MAKTKTFGVRLTPELIAELERLRGTFGFATYGEMMESWVHLLQNIDERVCQIEKHPKEWGAQDFEEHLGLRERNAASLTSIDPLVVRRLRERFGEDGVQRIHGLLRELSGGRNA